MKQVIKTARIGPFRGMNNRRPDHKLDVADSLGRHNGDFLRNAVNVDLTDTGGIVRRQGTTRALEGTDCHSAWADGSDAFLVDGMTLYRLVEKDGAVTRTVIRSGLYPGARLSFVRAGHGAIYWTNGTLLERITGEASAPVGVPVLNPAPYVYGASNGSLPAGQYQVAITRVSASGEESGSTAPVTVQVPNNGTIIVKDIVAGGDQAAIYITPPNDSQFYLAATTTASTVSFPVMPEFGGRIQTLLMRPMPAGHIVQWFNGRLLVAADSTLYYSEPFAPALHNPSRGYIQFASRIQIVAPCGGGIYVATADETHWLEGADIEAALFTTVLPYGALEGTANDIPNSTDVWWQSVRGMVQGNGAGQVKNLQEDDVVVQRATQGATLFRERDGLRQMLAALHRPEGFSSAGARSFAKMEIIRQGEEL